MAGTVAMLYSSATALATDLNLRLNGSASVTRNVTQFQCDAKGAALGLPVGPFAVEYINDGVNSLAIVPVAGASLIFVTISSGSGARYAAHEYLWWDAGARGVSFSSDSLAGRVQSVCHKITAR